MTATSRLRGIVLCLFPALFACSTETGPYGSLPDDAAYWVSGALHVHSSHSDGAGSLDDIARAAENAGLDFVIVTDHWSLDALEDGEEGYHGEALVLVGTEASTNVGHILALDLPPASFRFGRIDPEEVLRQIRELGGFAIVAHPDGDRDTFRWTGWDLRGYDGLELFNAFAAYGRNGTLRSLAYLFVNPYWQTSVMNWELGWNASLVEAWQSMLPDRKLAAWAGADAHGGISLGDGHFLTWPSYERVFTMARNYVRLEEPLSGTTLRDRTLIYRALREGRGYIAFNDRADAAQFRFWAEGGGAIWPVGSDVEADPDGRSFALRARAPATETRLSLFRDGSLVSAVDSGELTYTTSEPGIYRVEARLRVETLGGVLYEPWIASNPITILPPSRIAARVEANALPQPAAMRFELSAVEPNPMVLNVEPNPGCEALDLNADVFGEASFRARFRLKVPPRGEPDRFVEPYGRCALADRREQDLTGYGGIRFEARADAIYRVTFFIASPGPNRDTPTGVMTSFLTRTDWRDVTIPFSQLRSFPGRDDDVDFSNVSEMSFFIDTSNTRPGTSGQIELRQIGLIPAP